MIRIVLLILGLGLLVTCGGGSGGRDGPDVAFTGALPANVGPVCGNSAILGETIAPVRSARSSQCGISRPVRLYAVSGVALNPRPILNCKTARALRRWIAGGARPAVADMGEQLASLRVASHYACRTRNSQRGARVSEHGKGNAIDISGLRFTSGGSISVLRDWGKGAKGRALRSMRRQACGTFGVVLGPGSDAFHRDHFHFDVSNLSRPYCR